ncbi:MAG: 3-hydroxyacyl-ACP dehydratase [Desulfobacterales bacterium CG07_land_8_20_14_0_80_52_14]|nr:MAG: 3-hydroxyacyl-ACP dehydratase [Desulfobacterales bacterium CG23_combo_of_CG06-09_8_20_14_all_52_9]PIU49162.1 MAG: 3-hydroxyacyl-ACP dehydratase [Desulfobacterales bacterium CG07_land_8_20_14_0_80_52_14]
MHPLEQRIAAAMRDKPRIEPNGFVSGRFFFHKDFIGFSGHFPGYPILPACVQIASAFFLIRKTTPSGLFPTLLEKAKFILEIHPEDEVRIDCTRLPESGQEAWKAAVYSGKDLAATFHLTFQKAGGDHE